MKTKIWIMLLAVAGMAFSCGQSNSSGEYAYQEPAQKYSSDEMASEASAEEYDQSGGQPGQLVSEKKVIRTAHMRMEVKDYPQALAAVKKLATEYEGELTGENEQQYDGRLENTLVIRVPPQRFDSLLLEFGALASHVDFKSVNAEDVTRQYIDLETRLASKRAVVERYRELLQQAKNVGEILAVEENLRKVVEEIESIEGQLRYLSRQVGFSTINLTIYEKGGPASTSRSFWSRIGEGFSDGWQLLQSLAVGLVTLWPVLLIITLLLVWLVRRRRKRG